MVMAVVLIAVGLEIGQARYVRRILNGPFPAPVAVKSYAAHGARAVSRPVNNPCG